jgi:formate-dependent nitrite reductase cytochrome c552 subunit
MPSSPGPALLVHVQSACPGGERARYGGSEALPRTPDAQSRLEEDPRLVDFWKEDAFSEDFREERGHAYMLDEQLFTGRQVVTPQPVVPAARAVLHGLH